MAICPHCQTQTDTLNAPCPSGDGYFCIDEGEFAANPKDDVLGTNVGGRFIVESLLGSGSMARVYRANQVEVDRPVALKVFRVDELFGASEGALEAARGRFAQEARVLGKLAHPNCVTIFDFGADERGRFLYIAMEFVAGFSLRRAMKRGIKVDATIEIMRQVLEVLREAHSLEIVHRDLKPENIILSFRHGSDEPVVKVVDFGIAKLLGQSGLVDKTRVGALFGTPAYMSPEQCRGDVDEVGPHSDVYSVGCILFEILTGRLPFQSPVPMQMLQMHNDEPVPEIVPRAGLDVSEKLRDFVRKCMQKDPQARCPDAGFALHELMALQTGSSAPAHAIRAKPKRVVVPQNQISGVDIAPPAVALLPAQPTGPSPSVRVEIPSFSPEGGSVYDTEGGRSAAKAAAGSDPAAAGKAMVLIAFVFVSIACIVLFYFLWEMASKG